MNVAIFPARLLVIIIYVCIKLQICKMVINITLMARLVWIAGTLETETDVKRQQREQT